MSTIIVPFVALCPCFICTYSLGQDGLHNCDKDKIKLFSKGYVNSDKVKTTKLAIVVEWIMLSYIL